MNITDSNSPRQSLASEPQAYDPFSYPRLYPSGWNLDDLPANETSMTETEPESNPNTMPAWYEPFRDLRTFPSGWDLP